MEPEAVELGAIEPQESQNETHRQQSTLERLRAAVKNPPFGSGSTNASAESSSELRALLRESEERYAWVTQAAHDGIFDWNLINGNCYLSPRYKDILGYTNDELPDLSSSFFDRLHPDDISAVREMLGRVQTDPTIRTFEEEFRLRHKDGGYRHIISRGQVERDATGEPTRFLGSIRDLTEQLRAMAELAVSKKQLRDILDSSPGFLALLALDGRLIDVNVSALNTAGLTLEDTVGKPFWETAWWCDNPVEQDRLRDMLSRAVSGETVRYEADVCIAGGKQIRMDFSFGPFRNAQDQITSIIGFGFDITRSKEVESELLAAKQAAEAASLAKSEFLANMSHEIRTPMNGIVGLTEVVLESDLTDEQREYLKIVKSSADSLLAIISDILEISKLQAGQVALHPTQFSVKDLVNGSVKELVGNASAKGLQLTCSVATNVPTLMLGDSDYLQQILTNLIGNAIKFTAVGEVEILVTVSPEGRDTLHFSVRDTGIGIATDQQQIIFEPFSQVDSSSRRKFGGTGLGLAIAARLVKMMGGRIWVESDGHTGSTFRFTAPMEAVHISQEALSPEAAPLSIEELVPIMDGNPSSGGIERRQDTRWVTDDPASMTLLRPFSPIASNVRILDVSKSGLKLHASRFLESGTLVQIQLKNQLEVAEVRYCVDVGKGFIVGVKIRTPGP